MLHYDASQSVAVECSHRPVLPRRRPPPVPAPRPSRPPPVRAVGQPSPPGYRALTVGICSAHYLMLPCGGAGSRCRPPHQGRVHRIALPPAATDCRPAPAAAQRLPRDRQSNEDAKPALWPTASTDGKINVCRSRFLRAMLHFVSTAANPLVVACSFDRHRNNCHFWLRTVSGFCRAQVSVHARVERLRVFGARSSMVDPAISFASLRNVFQCGTVIVLIRIVDSDLVLHSTLSLLVLKIHNVILHPNDLTDIAFPDGTHSELKPVSSRILGRFCMHAMLHICIALPTNQADHRLSASFLRGRHSLISNSQFDHRPVTEISEEIFSNLSICCRLLPRDCVCIGACPRVPSERDLSQSTTGLWCIEGADVQYK